ncbi:MAG: PrgI family protein, partial [Microbacterium sp.]
MSTASTQNEFELSPVKFSRLTKRGIILGLSLPQVIALSVAVAVFIASLYTGGPAALYTAPLWGT